MKKTIITIFSIIFCMAGVAVAQNKNFEKWISEVKPLHEEYVKLYNILDSNRLTENFKIYGIPNLPNNYSKRITILRNKLREIPATNPFKAQVSDGLFRLDNLEWQYLNKGGVISESDELGKIIKRYAMEFYSKKDFMYKLDSDLDESINELTQEFFSDLNTIVDQEKNNKMIKLWNDTSTEIGDEGFSLQQKEWENQHTKTGEIDEVLSIYDGIYEVKFTPVDDTPIQRIYEIGINWKEGDEKTEAEIFEVIKKLTPTDTHMVTYYNPAEIISANYDSWKTAILLQSETVAKRMNDKIDDEAKPGQFLVMYDHFDYNPVTDEKADIIKSIWIRWLPV